MKTKPFTLIAFCLLLAGAVTLIAWQLVAVKSPTEIPVEAHHSAPQENISHNSSIPTNIPKNNSSSQTSTTNNWALNGLLIDSKEQAIAQGDILFQVLPTVNSNDCNSLSLENFKLSSTTGMSVSDEHGRFVLESPIDKDAKPACILISATKDGFRTTFISVPLEVINEVVEIELLAHEKIGGEVSFPNGDTAAGATVSIWPINSRGNQCSIETTAQHSTATSSYNESQRAVIANSLGHFLVEVEPGEYCLRASMPNWASSDILTVERLTDDISLTLKNGITVSGNIVDQNDQPLATTLLLQPLSSPLETITIQSDDNGFFHSSSLDSGEYGVRSESPLLKLYKPNTLIVDSDRKNYFNIEVDRVFVISGRAILPNGAPAVNAIVSTRSPIFPSKQLSTKTNKAGDFELISNHQGRDTTKMRSLLEGVDRLSQPQALDENAACLSIHHEKGVLENIEFTPDSNRYSLGALQLNQPNYVYNGIVRNQSGEPQAASVTIIPTSKIAQHLPPTHCKDSKSHITFETDENGKFSFSLESPGLIEVEVITERYSPRRYTLDLAQQHELITLDIK